MADADLPRPSRPDRGTYTRRRLIAVGLGLVAPTVALTAFHRQPPSAIVGDGSAATVSTVSTTTPPAPAPTAAPAVSTTAPAAPVLDHPLSLGMAGDPKIATLQDRLRELAFDPGPTDGYFGEATLRAVWAFEKLIARVGRDDATGIVTPELWKAIHQPVQVSLRRGKEGRTAPRGMDRVPITVDGETVTVDTGAIVLGPPIGTNTTGQEAEGPHCVSVGGESQLTSRGDLDVDGLVERAGVGP